MKKYFIASLAALLVIGGVSASVALATTTSATSTTTTSTSTTSTATTVFTPASRGGFAITSQLTPEIWKKGSRHFISWAASSTIRDSLVYAYLIPVNTAAGASTKKINIGGLFTRLNQSPMSAYAKALDRAPLGLYRLQLQLTPYGPTKNAPYPNGDRVILVTAPGTIQIVAPDPASIQITSPKGEKQWVTGSNQRVTWTANFVKGGNDVRIVPKYGIDPGHKNLDAAKFSAADRKALNELSPSDLLSLSKLSPDEIGDLDPTKLLEIPGLSSGGQNALKKLSPPGFEVLQSIDVLGIGNFTANLLFKPLQMLSSIDPLSKAIFGGLFGDDKPKAVTALVYLVPSTGGADIRLKKTYIEKANAAITLKNIAPGTYKIKLVAVLKNTKLIALSDTITVVARNQPNQSVVGSAQVTVINGDAVCVAAPCEVPVHAAQVTLYRASNYSVAATVTAATSGKAVFNGLQVGSYIAHATAPEFAAKDSEVFKVVANPPATIVMLLRRSAAQTATSTATTTTTTGTTTASTTSN